MIKGITIREISSYVEQGYQVWIISKNIDQIKGLIDDDTVIWEPNLAPSQSLLNDVQFYKSNYSWNKEIFISYFVPMFLRESNTQAFKDTLNKLYIESRNKKIALACYCGDETMCHRSVIMGLLKAVGAETEKDYSPYFLIYRMIQIGTYPEIKRPKLKLKQEKLL